MELTPTTSERSRAPGHSAAAKALAEALSAGDTDERGAEILPILREVAATVGPKYADVLSREDVLGELVLGAWDGWLEDWSDRVLSGAEHRSLPLFLRDRLRDHLREKRRTALRRKNAVFGAMGGPAVETGRADQPVGRALFSSEPALPDQDLTAAELCKAAAKDRQAEAVIVLRENGFTQDEIARVLRVSRPTVTRRLAVIAAALLAIVASAMVAITLFDDADDGLGAISAEPVTPAAELAPMPAAEAPQEEVEAEPAEATPEPEVTEQVAEAPVRRDRRGAMSRRPAKPPRRGVATSGRPGHLTINSMPWARVYVDGVDTGQNTPVLNMPLAPGRHQIELRVPSGDTRRMRVNIESDQTSRVVHRF